VAGDLVSLAILQRIVNNSFDLDFAKGSSSNREQLISAMI
jgi:hypothetical protein